jgi:hypothetical protein
VRNGIKRVRVDRHTDVYFHISRIMLSLVRIIMLAIVHFADHFLSTVSILPYDPRVGFSIPSSAIDERRSTTPSFRHLLAKIRTLCDYRSGSILLERLAH